MLLSPEDAWQRIDRRLAPLPPEWIPRRQAAGRVLAGPLLSLVDLPPADVAAMDGYAVAGEVATGAELPVLGLVAAGHPPGRALPAGACLRIMTGAPLPDGADRVVPFEWTDGGRERVRFARPVRAGEAVRRRAEVCRAGTPLLEAGVALSPGALSLLAAHGYERVLVHRPPRIAVLATGDEVVPPESSPGPGQLRDSHTDFLLAAAAALAVPAVALGISRDDPEELSARIASGLEHDLLLVCGGVSAGELDLVEGALARAGCVPLFDGVAIQPGKPLVAATHARGLAFGLPGNPASAMVGWWLFVRPAIRRLLGFADGFWRGAVPVTAGAALPPGMDRDRFLPARLTRDSGGLVATPIPTVGSHDLPAFARAEALLRVAAGAAARAAGEPAEALPLPETANDSGG